MKSGKDKEKTFAVPSLFLRYEVDHNSIVDWRNSSVTLESQWSNTIGINLGRTLCPPLIIFIVMTHSFYFFLEVHSQLYDFVFFQVCLSSIQCLNIGSSIR